LRKFEIREKKEINPENISGKIHNLCDYCANIIPYKSLANIVPNCPFEEIQNP
jgi:hypothetical protein